MTQYFWPERFRINDIAKGLIEEGHEIVVLTGMPNFPKGQFFKGYGLFGPFKERHEGITIYRVPHFPRGKGRGVLLALNYLSFFIIASLLAPILIREKIDKIFVYQLSPVMAAFPAIVLRWFKGCPIYFWVTDLWPETLEATNLVRSKYLLSLCGKFVKYMYDSSHIILVSSKGFIKRIEARGIPKEKIIYWPQWGESLFSDFKIQKEKLPRDEVPQGFNIMFAGNIGTSQSFDTILDAAEKLKNKKDINWVILGDGLQRKWVEQEVVRRNLQENFFLLGSKPLESMPSYYSLSDVLLASLRKDPLFAITVPAKIQSYLPSGKPLLVSMDGEGADLVIEARAGVACKASDASKLADGALKLYNLTKEEREEMGKCGALYFHKNFERKLLLNKLMSILK